VSKKEEGGTSFGAAVFRKGVRLWRRALRLKKRRPDPVLVVREEKNCPTAEGGGRLPIGGCRST